jgi:hypothetical protein
MDMTQNLKIRRTLAFIILLEHQCEPFGLNKVSTGNSLSWAFKATDVVHPQLALQSCHYRETALRLSPKYYLLLIDEGGLKNLLSSSSRGWAMASHFKLLQLEKVRKCCELLGTS